IRLRRFAVATCSGQCGRQPWKPVDRLQAAALLTRAVEETRLPPRWLAAIRRPVAARPRRPRTPRPNTPRALRPITAELRQIRRLHARRDLSWVACHTLTENNARNHTKRRNEIQR